MGACGVGFEHFILFDVKKLSSRVHNSCEIMNMSTMCFPSKWESLKESWRLTAWPYELLCWQWINLHSHFWAGNITWRWLPLHIYMIQSAILPSSRPAQAPFGSPGVSQKCGKVYVCTSFGDGRLSTYVPHMERAGSRTLASKVRLVWGGEREGGGMRQKKGPMGRVGLASPLVWLAQHGLLGVVSVIFLVQLWVALLGLLWHDMG